MDAATDRRYVTALARGLELLQCFRFGERWLSHREITERTQLPKATVSRLAFTLAAQGFLQHDAQRGMYCLGPGGLALGFRALANMEVAALARPVMDRLATWSQAAVSLGLRHQQSMVYIAHSRGHARLTLSLDIGARIPIASTSMGRAWLCALDEAARVQVHEELKAELGRAWPAAKAALARADEQFRSLGFVTSEGEWASDISAVGAPVRGPTPGECYALSIGGPSNVLTHERLFKLLGPRVAEAAHEITEALRLSPAR